jgi:hypothetical protein
MTRYSPECLSGNFRMKGSLVTVARVFPRCHLQLSAMIGRQPGRYQKSPNRRGKEGMDPETRLNRSRHQTDHQQIQPTI